MRPDRTYIGRMFPKLDIDTLKSRRARILNQVFDQEEQHELTQVGEEIVLRITPGGREEVKAFFYEDTRKIWRIVFQRFNRKDGTPQRISLSFDGTEIERLFNLLKLINYIDLESSEKVRLDDRIFNQWLTTEEEKTRYLLENPDLIAELAANHITKSDIVALAYRRKQLEIFEGLLRDDTFFKSKMKEWGVGREAVWQQFFESNPWIFGYGLTYIFTSPLDNKKLVPG